METKHTLLCTDARDLSSLASESIDLVVTSPPYPMIMMWDNLFSQLSTDVTTALEAEDGTSAFEAMHAELDKVWQGLYRVLRPGSFACINIGDATRTIAGRFRLYPNHARIISAFGKIGFDTLPLILWRKQTNAPNKFMGSGMLPAGAYVTLEHEYILIFRKGAKRVFASEQEKKERMAGSFFWEERNTWFSDVWDFKGTAQILDNAAVRGRSAAYPLELPLRLIAMYSLYSDTVLDPFMGTGTTALAALAGARNSVGVEIDAGFAPMILTQQRSFLSAANDLLYSRIRAHAAFIQSRRASGGDARYVNEYHGFPVITRQETGIRLYRVSGISNTGQNETTARYELADDVKQTDTSRRAFTGARGREADLLSLDLFDTTHSPAS